MIHKGSCSCKRWQVEVEVTKPLDEFNPRSCDCDYCKNSPSAIISDPNMRVELVGGEFTIHKNGDQLANFYYCDSCGDLLAVGRDFNNQLRGAANANLLRDSSQLGQAIAVQPRLLSIDEKLDRWGKLWGQLNIYLT
ncbi:MAG: hypothetical protein JKY50_04140 [Oleispira sp.]|nr:hypothetical protein [Oleispira sp.]